MQRRMNHAHNVLEEEYRLEAAYPSLDPEWEDIEVEGL